MNTSWTCTECGTPLDDDLQSNTKKPCPNCGSLIRSNHVTVEETTKAFESLGTKQKNPARRSREKLRVDTFTGYQHSHSLGRMVKKERIIDKDNDQYYEKITDPETEKIVHECKEKLSEHQNHGYAKNKKKP